MVTAYRDGMTHHVPVPSDLEPTSIRDLVDDCRAVSQVLGHCVIDLTLGTLTGVARASRVPLARTPLDRLPFSFGAMPVEITEDLLVTVAGLDDY